MPGSLRLLLACLLTVQGSSGSVERELSIRALSLESASEFVVSADREGARIQLESLGRRARVRGILEGSELALARESVESEDATLREWSLRCLIESGLPLHDDRTRAAAVVEGLAEDPHPAVRLALTKLLALQQEDHPNALTLLTKLRADRHPDVAHAALFALLEAPKDGSDATHDDRWQEAAAQAMGQLLGPETSQPMHFLDAVETAANIRSPFRQGLLRRLAQDLEQRNASDLLGARALVEAARVEPGSQDTIDEALLLQGFLVLLPGDEGRVLPRAARRRIQRAATRVLGLGFAEKQGRIALSTALDLDPAAKEWEGVGFRLECALSVARPEELARVAVVNEAPEEWWSLFFDAIRGRVCEFEPAVLDFWIAPERSLDGRWEALRALVASWAADAPLVRDRFDDILHEGDREHARDLFGLLARAQHTLAGDSAAAQQAWDETDQVLFRAWTADKRPVRERVRELDQLSRAAPHHAYREAIFDLCSRGADTRTASVLELCSGLVTDREREQNDWNENASEALLWAHKADRAELRAAAEAGRDLREIETRVRHELRAYAGAQIYGWRTTLLDALKLADSVASDDVAKTAAALLAKSGPEGIELLRAVLKNIQLVRARLEILLSLAPVAEIVGAREAASAAAELRERYARCDLELKLRVVRTLGNTVAAEGLAVDALLANADFLTRTALDGSQASQLRTAAVAALARACQALGSADRLRRVATELGGSATGLRAAAEGALEARLVALEEIARFATPEEAEEFSASTAYLLDALGSGGGVLDALARGDAAPPEAQVVRAELEREVLLPALAPRVVQRGDEVQTRLRAEWSRQLTGTLARATLAERLDGRKLPRREFVLRAELAGLAAATDAQSAEVLLVPELDPRSALLAVRVIRGQPEFRLALLERAIVGFVGESPSEEAARFDLEVRLRSLLLRLEAAEPGTQALKASLRFDLANPDRSGARAVELVFFSSESEVPAAERALSVRARALRRFDNLVQTAKSRASARDR